MRIAAVFGTRDKIIVNVIRETVDVPVKWYFSYEEILAAGIEYDWVIASTSAPCQGQSSTSEAIVKLREICGHLILFAKEPLFEDENIHWIVGKHFTVREIKERLKQLINITPEPISETIEATSRTGINAMTKEKKEVSAGGVLVAVGQEDIEARLGEANINIIARARDCAELLSLMKTLQPEVVALSIRLPGLENPKEVVAGILTNGHKLVLLAGDTDPDDKWLTTLQSMGINVIFDPVNISDLLAAISGDVKPSGKEKEKGNSLFVRLRKITDKTLEHGKESTATAEVSLNAETNYNKAIMGIEWYSSANANFTSNGLQYQKQDTGSENTKGLLDKLSIFKAGAERLALRNQRSEPAAVSPLLRDLYQRAIEGTNWYSSDGNSSLISQTAFAYSAPLQKWVADTPPQADKFLYEAKRAGRNQVKMDPSPESPMTGCKNGKEVEQASQVQKESSNTEGINTSGHVILTKRAKGKAKTVTVTSLHDDGPFELIMAIVHHLTGNEPVAIIDGDLEHRVVGSVLGVDSNLLADHSWDRQIVPVVAGNIKLFPLNRQSYINPTQDSLKNVIDFARQETNLVFVHCGSIKDTWYYRRVLEESDFILWDYRDDKILPDEARYRWAQRLKIFASLKTRCREAITFHGHVNIALIRDVFHVPVVKLKCNKDRKSLEQLMEIIINAPCQANSRILVAGYKDLVPDKAGVLYDVIYDPEEASEWVRTHHYDSAIVNPEIKGAALLKFDLSQRGIPFSELQRWEDD